MAASWRRVLVRLRYAGAQVYWRTVRPTTVGVKALVIDRQRRVVLVRHSYQMSHGWYLPGGGVRRGETIMRALRRELLEEIGADMTGDPHLLGLYSNLGEGKRDHVAVFVVEHWTPGRPTQSDEIAEIGTFSLHALPADLTPATRRRIDEYLGGSAPSFEW